MTEQELLRRLFDAMPQLGWTAQPDGFVDYYNLGWYEYTGSDYEAMQGWGWKSVHHPDELPRVMESWGLSIATGKPWEIEFPLRRHDGVYRWFLSRATPIYDNAGTLIRWVGINTDIDDQKRAEQQLAELDRAKTAFFSNVSHELRTPLTLILGPIEQALRSSERALSGAELEVAHRNAIRLLKLVNTLLDFSRIEAGRAQATYVATDISAFTRDLASSFESAFGAAGLRFEVDCPPLDMPVSLDRDMWEKVVLNLLSNALKFTFAGEITVRLRRVQANVELCVTDTGTGIPASELPHVFERFRRVGGARSRTHEGSGIGLALVQEIVRMHGGSVAVESTEGLGTTFTVRLPLGKEHLAAESIGVVSTRASTAAGATPYVLDALRWLPGNQESARAEHEELVGQGSMNVPDGVMGARILLADDNADMREYLARLLGERWQVEAVADGMAALDAARRATPDLILTDVMMPNLDGFGLLRALRADPALKAVPVIMLSARAGEDSRIEGLEIGADDYLVKPFSARELMARIAAQLQISRLRESAIRERDRLEAAQHEAERYQTLLATAQRAANIGIFDWDMRTTEVYWSPELFALLGLAPEDVVPTPDRWNERIHPEDVERGWAEFSRACDERRVAHESDQRVRHSDGSIRWIRITNHIVYDETGKPARVIGAVLDIENLKQLAERERLARTQAEDANRTKDEFLAMLGHELRNPLAPILTALQLVRLRGTDGVAREIDVIERQAHHLVRLVDDLLDVSRIAQGKVTLAKESVEIASVIALAIEMASPLIENGRHKLVTDVPKQGVVVDIDRGRMAQVLANLLTNAAKYTPVGGRIRIAAKRVANEVVVTVEDNGTGISPELLPNVFDLFVQARQTLARSQGGLGLGLSLVKSLVTMHGGSVSAESKGIGKGSKFTVRLPALDARPKAHEAARALPNVRQNERRILVVDDNADAADMLAEALQMLGYRTAIAHDGLTALTLAHEFEPHTALLDIGLPVMDGYELAGRLRAERGADLVLVAITGYGQESDRRRSRDAGFKEHVTKPVDLIKLAKLLETLVLRTDGDG